MISGIMLSIGGLNDHVGFSVFEDLNIGNLAAFDNDGNIDLTVVTIALTFVCFRLDGFGLRCRLR